MWYTAVGTLNFYKSPNKYYVRKVLINYSKRIYSSNRPICLLGLQIITPEGTSLVINCFYLFNAPVMRTKQCILLFFIELACNAYLHDKLTKFHSY